MAVEDGDPETSAPAPAAPAAPPAPGLAAEEGGRGALEERMESLERELASVRAALLGPGSEGDSAGEGPAEAAAADLPAAAASLRQEVLQLRRERAAQGEELAAAKAELEKMRERERYREQLALAEAENLGPISARSGNGRPLAQASTFSGPWQSTPSCESPTQSKLAASRASAPWQSFSLPSLHDAPGGKEANSNQFRRMKLATLKGTMRSIDEDVNTLRARDFVKMRCLEPRFEEEARR